MKKTVLLACFSLCILAVGCRPAETPVEPSEPRSRPRADVQQVSPPAPAPASKYSEEQIAAARQLAAELGVVVKEDGDGNVILLDTAADRSWVDDFQMQEMLVFEGLTSLTVEGPSITDALAPRIAEQTSLVSLALRNTLLGDQGIAQFTALESLKVIDLRVSPMVTDAALETLGKMPQLRAVRLTGCNVTDAGIARLLDLPSLTELDVRNCRGVTVAGVESLRAAKTLRVLKIGGLKIDDRVLETVARLEKLTGLSLDNCDISDAGLAHLAGLPLVDLTVYQSARVSDGGLEILSHYTDLKHLTLRDVPATGSALAKLPNPQKLLSLNMAQSAVTDAQLPSLARMASLKILNLSETGLTDAAIDALSKLTSLEQIMLTQTQISADGMSRLRQALPECSIRSE